MAKSNKDEGLVIGGAVIGLLMGGTALGATGTMSGDTGEFFKYNEVKSGFHLAAAGEETDEKTDEKTGEETDEETGEEKPEDGEKKCGGKDKKCGEASCG